MTEAEWLACEDPRRMLTFLRGRTSERKLKLFACACWRRVWHLFGKVEGRSAVELVERGADAPVNEAELGQEAATRAIWACLFLPAAEAAATTSGVVVWGVKAAVWQAATGPELAAEAAAAAHAEEKAQCRLLRDVFGNPFRPVTIDPAWLAWANGTVRHIAEAIYEGRAFDRLPVLADALEDAGCDNAHILAHCREPGEHVRGCWVLDLLLGKA